MRKPNLVWSHVQLKLDNQLKVIPYGRMVGALVEVEGLRSFADFEGIEIVDDIDRYPGFLSIDWDIENQNIINMKKRMLAFEGGDIKVVAPFGSFRGTVEC